MMSERLLPNVENGDTPRVRILLHLMRHAEKAADNRIPDEEDVNVPLTDIGRLHAMTKGIDMGGIASRPLAVGGPRLRTKETALRALAGINPNLADTESFEELLATTDEQGIPYSARMLEDELLDVPFVKGTHIHDVLTTAYEEGHYMRTLVKNHRDIEQGTLKEVDVYAIQASNIARIVQRHVELAGKYSAWISAHNVSEEEHERDMERVVSTHGGVAESFIAEIIRRTRGEAELEKFLDVVPNGVAYADAFDIEIISANNTNDPEIRIQANFGTTGSKYSFDDIVPIRVINEIVAEFSTQ